MQLHSTFVVCLGFGRSIASEIDTAPNTFAYLVRSDRAMVQRDQHAVEPWACRPKSRAVLRVKDATAAFAAS